jgi:protein Tex
METTVRRIAGELGVREDQIEAALRLLSEGATVPFLARYRKEATGGLSLSHLRSVEDRLQQVRELDERRAFILKAVSEQGRLTPDLQALVATAETRARLEDLYLPFKQKRRSRANQARDLGLEPLADLLLSSPHLSPEEEGARFVDAEKGIADGIAALDGARWILMERLAEDPRLLDALRQYVLAHALLQAKVVDGRQEKGAKFAEFFAFSEPARALPSHRVLALFRGRKEGVLRLALVLPPGPEAAAAAPAALAAADGGEAPTTSAETTREAPGVPERMIAERFGIRNEGRPADAWLVDVVRRAWKMKIFPYVQVEIEGWLRDQAERDAIQSYARSLRDLLMAAPAGRRTVMGIDPGLRTGIKVGVVDAAGAVVETASLFPHQPKNEWEPSVDALTGLITRHGVELIGIGNGTGSRETDRLLSDVARRNPELAFSKVIVSEAGASSFASSRLAARELSTLEVALRAAVNVARRLQDPLAELVKIEPRTIGVGQYQHDVNQAHLSRALVATLEDCVCEVGVDLNTAGSALLGRVAGLNHRLADNIVAVRATAGPFKTREELRSVPGISDRVFEQAAGFLQIRAGDQVLDATRIHPELYPLVERMAASAGRPIAELFGNDDALQAISLEAFIDDTIGLPTLHDIVSELRAPAEDPRPVFRVAAFKEGLDDMADLKAGMMLEGVVTNVATFGAFVDIGVHQDGLVHVSRLADRFVKDPHDVVKSGDIVQVKVLEVDLERKRIALTMRFERRPAAPPQRVQAPRPPREASAAARPVRRIKPAAPAPAPKMPSAETAMGAAFSRLLKRP